MKHEIVSFTWNCETYCYNLYTSKYWKEVFIQGEGWKKEKCTYEEYDEAAFKYYRAMNGEMTETVEKTVWSK